MSFVQIEKGEKVTIGKVEEIVCEKKKGKYNCKLLRGRGKTKQYRGIELLDIVGYGDLEGDVLKSTFDKPRNCVLTRPKHEYGTKSLVCR